MTDPAAGTRNTAGSLLRAARERQGLHIAALAAAIKVSPRKLDALEHDRYEELPDATFTRALAQTVCRTLKIDARPVLALLPAAESASLEQVAGSLNTPFRERPGPGDSGLATSAIRPLIWASGVLMVAALVLHFLPERWWQAVTSVSESAPAPAPVTGASTPLPAASPASAAAAAVVDASASATPGVAVVAAAPVVETVFSAPPPAPGASAPPPSTLLQIRASDASWIEVQDSRSQVLLSRTVQPGETVGLDGALPLRLTIGNASVTQLVFRGRPVDLAAITRDNVARVELK